MSSYVKVFNKETNTFPTIIHANGKAKNPGKTFSDSWPEIIKRFRESNPIRKNLREDLTIVTWKGGKYNNVTTILEEACDKFGVEVKILPWPSHIHDFWEASKAKAYETLNAIKSGQIKTKYIMAFDAGDVIFLNHPNDILDSFIQLFPNFKTVWCTEANDWPRFNLPKYVHHPILDDYLTKISAQDRENAKNHGTRFSFLNAGCVIGETQYLIPFYESSLKICADIKTNDQAMARISQYIDPVNHGQDNLCQMFQCLYDVGLETLEVNTDNE